jgi:hypothetical protein
MIVAGLSPSTAIYYETLSHLPWKNPSHPLAILLLFMNPTWSFPTEDANMGCCEPNY